MAKLNVLGLDPSYRNWGIAAGSLDTDTHQFTLNHVAVIQTEKTSSKQLRVNSDDLSCAEILWKGLVPYFEQVHVIFVEVPVGSQSAASMKGYGICIGLLGAIRGCGKPFFELTPKEVKLAATGNPEASKAAMIDWATKQYPHDTWPTEVKKGVTKIIASKAEHMADALGAIHAGLESNQFRQFAAMKLH